MLQREGLIDDAFIRKIMKWRHTSGFSAHNGMQIKPDDEKGKEALAQYIIAVLFLWKRSHTNLKPAHIPA